jgi:hypothetical protein
LNDHPGILPFRLGIAQLESNQWTFIQNINLNPLINKFYNIKDHTNTLSNSLKNNSDYHREYHNSFTSLNALEKRIENLIEQIVPTQKNIKRKRGLFNPLGSFIKALTGNLDQQDAEQIDARIEKLQNTQNKLKIDTINQITLLDSTINKFKTMISNITHNEIILKSRILQIESIINKVEIHQTDFHQYYLSYTIITQITLMYQSIYDILDKIEIAITFAKINVLHNSIIEPNELLAEIKNLNNHLNTDKLPLEPKPQNILIFEKLITIKSFLKGNNIVFMLELPLVESETYQYFNLFPLPIPNNQSFLAIIPFKPYLALGSTKYAYTNQRCLEIQSQNYLCRETRTALIKDNPSCAVQLIKHHQNVTTCHPFKTQLHEIQSTKITNGKWLITIPSQTISIVKCQKSEENIPVFGSYLLEASIDCKVQIKSKMFETYKSSQLLFSKVNLPSLNLSLINQSPQKLFELPAMDLNFVNLEATKDIQAKLKKQKEELEEMSSPIYANRTSFWTISLYFLLFLIIIYIIYRKFIVKKSKNNTINIIEKSKNSNNDQNQSIF